MKIFIIVGMPAAGKNIARAYAENNGIAYFASGDIVRETVRERGLNQDADSMASVSTQLRGSDGLGVTRRVLAAALASGEDKAFMEGMRSWQEIELARCEASCVVVAFLAPRLLRLSRIIARGRSDDSPAAYEERDMREIKYGAAAPIALADEYILNTSNMEAALASLDAIVKKYGR